MLGKARSGDAYNALVPFIAGKDYGRVRRLPGKPRVCVLPYLHFYALAFAVELAQLRSDARRGAR